MSDDETTALAATIALTEGLVSPPRGGRHWRMAEAVARWHAEQVRELQAENEQYKAERNVADRAVVQALSDRNATREQVRQQGEVIERVRALADEFANSPVRPERLRAALDGESNG